MVLGCPRMLTAPVRTVMQTWCLVLVIPHRHSHNEKSSGWSSCISKNIIWDIFPKDKLKRWKWTEKAMAEVKAKDNLVPSAVERRPVLLLLPLVEKDPERATPMFWAAISAGDRVDSALKDMAIVMKQQNRTEEAIEAIKSLRHKCSEQSQEGLDNILLDLYKRCNRLDDQISLLQHKLSLISMGKAFNGRLTKTARSQGKKFQVSIQQEATRLLGNLGWAYMQKLDYLAAESSYRQALAFEPDDNKICNLVICLLHRGRVEEARSYMQRVKPARADVNDSHLKSYERAKEMLMELESNPNLKIKIQAENTNTQIINVVNDENTNINIIPAPTQAPLGFPLKPKPQFQVEQQNPLRSKNFRASPKENVNPNVSYGSSVTVFKNAVPFYPKNENMLVPFYPKNENIVKPFVPRNQNMVRPFMPIEEKAPLRVANGGNGMAFHGSMAMGMQTYAGHNNLMGMGKSAFAVEQPERSPFSNLQRLPFSDISGVHYQEENQFPQHVMGNPSWNSLSFGSSLNSTSGIPHMPLMNTGSIGRTSSSIGILDSLFTLLMKRDRVLLLMMKISMLSLLSMGLEAAMKRNLSSQFLMQRRKEYLS